MWPSVQNNLITRLLVSNKKLPNLKQSVEEQVTYNNKEAIFNYPSEIIAMIKKQDLDHARYQKQPKE